MNKLFCGTLLLFTLSACNDQISDTNDNKNSITNGEQNEVVTWKSKFPSLWGTAYASDINPENVSYEQFLIAVSEKLKTDVNFTNVVKGDTGDQGVMGSIGPQGIQGNPGRDGTDGTDGTDAIAGAWETMYSFGQGDSFFYTCNSNTPCTAADISFHKSSISSAVEHYIAANPSVGPIEGSDLLNTGASISNIDAASECEYKAEILSVNSGVSHVLTSPEIHNGSLHFKTQSSSSSLFDVQIGDASIPLKPRLIISKRLPASYTATQTENDRIADDMTSVGTHLGFQLILKRLCL